MSHLFRFHGQRRGVGDWILLPEEWHHLLKVLRLERGSLFEISDGSGWTAWARLAVSGKHEGSLELQNEVFTPALPPEQQVTIGLAAIKPQSLDEIIPPLVELGLDRLLVFPYAGMAKSRLNEKVFERWQRIVAAASKQCKRAWWPEIIWLESFDEFLSEGRSYAYRLLLDPQGEQLLADWLPEAAGSVLAAIGSEKGFSEEELRLLKTEGFEATRIEGAVLRAMTAALATTTLLRHNRRFRSRPS